MSINMDYFSKTHILIFFNYLHQSLDWLLLKWHQAKRGKYEKTVENQK